MRNFSVVPAAALPGDLSFEQWVERGEELGRAEGQLQWAIGDWWAYGEHRYGRRKEIVDSADWRGPAYTTCMDCASVARKFETSRRREALTFSHHREVAHLLPTEADASLDWCEEPLRGGGKRPRSVRDLRMRKSEIAAAADAAFRASLPLIRPTPVRSTEVVVLHIVPSEHPPAQPIGEPAVELDTSAAGPAPPALRDLQVEPAVALDRVAIARAALAALSFPDALQLVSDWHDTLSTGEQAAARSRLALVRVRL
jgi:hypothetical protein